MSTYAVIGAGPMGLACAYELLRNGYSVDIYEADDRLGGMSAHFDFNGLSIERYYHFICKPDDPLFELLEELNLKDKLHWVNTSMGYFYNGMHYDWGNPLALLKFKPLSLIDRLRYGVHMFYCTKIKNWKRLDAQEASQWIKKWIGKKAYRILWERLFSLKFHKYVGNLSAAWIWARIHRVGNSRKSIFQEQMGYMEGGSETLLNTMDAWIRQHGGSVQLSCPVKNIQYEQGRIIGITLPDGGTREYENVISTVPLPFVPRLINDLPESSLQAYESIQNIGVVCLIFKLRRSITPHFWLNISDSRIEIPGIIEFSNLRPFNEHIVYVPFYLPRDNPKYQQSDDDFIAESLNYFRILSPDFNDDDVIDVNVSRYGFAQPICPPSFPATLPPIETEIEGLYVMDTSYYYPEDRSISESVKLGREVARKIVKKN